MAGPGLLADRHDFAAERAATDQTEAGAFWPKSFSCVPARLSKQEQPVQLRHADEKE